MLAPTYCTAKCGIKETFANPFATGSALLLSKLFETGNMLLCKFIQKMYSRKS